MAPGRPCETTHSRVKSSQSETGVGRSSGCTPYEKCSCRATRSLGVTAATHTGSRKRAMLLAVRPVSVGTTTAAAPLELQDRLGGDGDEVVETRMELLRQRLHALPEVEARAMRLRRRGDPRQGRDGFHGVHPAGRLRRQHDAVRPVQDGVRHVGGFGPGRLPAVRHRFQHLRRRDDRLPRPQRLPNEALLEDADLLDRHFDTQISARDHETVGGREDLVHPLERPCPFDLRDDERLVAEAAGSFAHGLDVGGGLHERLAHGVDAVPKREFEAPAIVLGERGDAEVERREG